jgi:hypothetical protein
MDWPHTIKLTLSRIVGANPPPVFLREGVVAQGLLDRRFHKLGGSCETQAAQLLDHSDGPFARRNNVLAGMDRLEHCRNLPHLGRGHVAEDVAVPVHYGIVEEVVLSSSLCGCRLRVGCTALAKGSSAQERKNSGCQPFQIDGCGGQIGLNAHVREAAPDSAGKSMPGLCLAMEAFRAPTMPLIEPSILLAPSITAASRPK